MLIGLPAQSPIAVDAPTLAYVTTAHQLGVVGYRDPVGAISPDGTRLAYAEGRFIRIVPVGGGAPMTLPPGDGQIRYLAWKGNAEIIAEDRTAAARWWSYRIGSGARTPLWDPAFASALSHLTFSTDAQSAAAIALHSTGPDLVRLDAHGTVVARTRLSGRVSFPAFRSNTEIACVIDLKVTTPCGGAALIAMGQREAYGPIAFSPDGNTLYYGSANARGMVELASADLSTRRSRRLSNVSRDAYAPSVSSNGTVVFKTQTYRTHLADVPIAGGATRQLTTFQSETPSYHPAQPLIAFTYGTWRRVIDDGKYPDIAQEIGTIDVSRSLPFAEPSEILEQSDSEDQAMTWSPNSRWIAFHSHKEMSDDVWLRPADGSQPDKRITFLGRGAEVGWPRWSPDGGAVLLNGARKSDGESVLYVLGVNQDTGVVTSELRESKVEGITGEMGHAEWMPTSESVIAIAKEGPGRHVIFTVPAAGGRAAIVHRVDTEHDFPGLGVSPDGKLVAFVAPASDGFFQIFVKETGSDAQPRQLTVDRSHKTQPAFSPDGGRVAFTVWSYDAMFWSFREK
jgi:Tol biopolymer transport system component